MSTKLSFIMIFVIIFSVLDAGAQQHGLNVSRVTKEPVLTLEDAIEEATAHNPLLHAYHEEYLSRKANIEPQSALEDPSINLELDDYPASSLNPRSTDAGNRISVRQRLPFPGKRAALKDAATQESFSSQNDFESKRLETIAELKSNYYELSFAFASADLLIDQLKLIRSTLNLARSNFSLGKAPQSDVLTLQVEEATLLDEQVQLDRQIESTRSRINHLLGRNTIDRWKPETITRSNRTMFSMSEAELLDQALKVSPILKSTEAQINTAKAKERYAHLTHYPDFDVMVGYNFRRSNSLDSGEDEVSAGVGLTIPLWRSTKQDKLVEKAAADKHKSESLYTETKNEIIHSLHRVLAELNESEARLSLARNALLPLTHAAIVSAEKAYEVGNVQLISVLNLLRSRYVAQLNYQEALRQREVRIAQLEKLLGGSLDLNGK